MTSEVSESSQDGVASRVSKYYDSVQWVYNLGHFVYNLGITKNREKARSVHYGVWFENTKSMVEALLNVDLLAARGLDLGPLDTLLDAGCGVGGTSIFLAATFGCKVVGITVSDTQLRQARANAMRAGVGHLTTFLKMDFTKMRFPDKTFTKVVGIESVCYAYEKRRFVEEAHRVLDTGGRLVVTDAFLRRQPATAREELDLMTFYKGWKVPSLETIEQFSAHLNSAEFNILKLCDLTGGTVPTAKIIYNMHLPLYPLALLLSRLDSSPSSQDLLGHVKASLSQIKLGPYNRNGLISYWMFVSEKRA